jgi:hypothetical protein
MARLEAVPGFPLRMSEALWVEKCDEFQTALFGDVCRYQQITSRVARTPPPDRRALVGVVMEGCAPMVDPVDRGQCTFDVMMTTFGSTSGFMDPVTWTELCLGPAGAIGMHCLNHGVDNWVAAMVQPSAAPAWFSPSLLEGQFAAMGRASAGAKLSAVVQLTTMMQALTLREGWDAQRFSALGVGSLSDRDFKDNCRLLVGCAELLKQPELRWGQADMDPWWLPDGGVP